jgi:hypothetical protein
MAYPYPAPKRTVAIAGSGGNVGRIIAEIFIQPPFRELFEDVIILAQSPTAKTQELVDWGATLRLYDMENPAAAFTGVDVFINAFVLLNTLSYFRLADESSIGPAGAQFRNSLLTSLKDSNVKLYFPSEFGVDHYNHDFPHEEWDAKKHHLARFFELNIDLKMHICRVFPGLLLEDSIGPWFGFDTTNGVYDAVGDTMQLCSYTSKVDLAKALVILASSPENTWAKDVHLSGDCQAVSDIAEFMNRAGGGPIEVKSTPLKQYKQQVLATPTPTPERYLRFLMGEGKIVHFEGIGVMGCQNFLVDRHPSFGRWRTVQDLALETNGRPWAGATWGSAGTNQ